MALSIENQVCTLEQAKRLAELGIETESLFEWIEFDEDDAPEITLIDRRYSRPNIHAYTVAELGEMLPAIITFEKNNTASILFSKIDSWFIGYNKNPHGGTVLLSEGKTEAQARASMLIHLLETGILNPQNFTS